MSQPAAEPLVRLDGVSMGFGAQPVLRDLSLPVRRGETLLVIGESGCGKTVLLKLLVGLLRPAAGRVRFEERDLATLTAKELVKVRRRFGFLFQGAARTSLNCASRTYSSATSFQWPGGEYVPAPSFHFCAIASCALVR